MAKHGMGWQVTLLVVAGLLATRSPAFAQRGHGSVRPPSGGGGQFQKPQSGGEKFGGGQSERQQPHPGNQSMSAYHTGNVSGGQHSSKQDAATAEHHSNSDPYGRPGGFPGNQPHSQAATAAVAHNPNMGTTRPPYDGQRPPGSTSGQTTAASHSANTYGGVTVNNNNSINQANANRANVGSVQNPYGTRTPYGTPYATALPPGHQTVAVAGTQYHYSGGNFYQPMYSGGSVVYAPTPPAQMSFSGTGQPPPAPPPNPYQQQPDPEQQAAAALNTAKVLLNQPNDPNARAIALETLANIVGNSPGTMAAAQAQALLKSQQ